MGKRHKSRALSALHESMSDLHRGGAIDDSRMQDYDDACIAADEPTQAAGAGYVVYRDAEGCWRWTLRSGDGKVVASSGESYRSRAACLAAIDLLKSLAGAPVPA